MNIKGAPTLPTPKELFLKMLQPGRQAGIAIAKPGQVCLAVKVDLRSLKALWVGGVIRLPSHLALGCPLSCRKRKTGWPHFRVLNAVSKLERGLCFLSGCW